MTSLAYGDMAQGINPDAPKRIVIRYQGAKNRIAPWIISHFPPHKVYCESFGGSAGILMQKKRTKTEVYNDLASNVVNIFKVLRDKEKAKELQRLLELTPWSRQEFRESFISCESDSDIEQARKMIIRSFMGLGSGMINRGIGGFSSRIDKESYRCNQTGAWLTYIPSIPEFTDRLQGVIIENRKAQEVIEIYDTPFTLHYVDPPYMLTTWNKNDKNCYKYIMTDSEHEQLINQLKTVKGYVILSGYENDLYKDLLPDWILRKKETRNQLREKRTECIWISPSAWDALHKQGSLM